MRSSTGLIYAAVIVVAAGVGGFLYYSKSGTTPVPAAGTAPATGQAAAQTGVMPEVKSDDMVLGSPDAKVTIIEYASLTCPHCQRFHIDTFPKLKAEFIDTGKVKLVFRDFPFDEAGLRASMMARCGGKEKFFGYLSALYQSMDSWTRESDWKAALARIGKLGGMSQEAFDKCMADKSVEQAILNKRLEGAQQLGVDSTPTFFINGEKLAGTYPYERYADIIKRKLPAS